MEWTVAIGVDTHKDVHVAVALDRFGAQLGSHQVATTAAGYGSLRSWALELGRPAFAVEGAGSYGAGLVRFLERAGVAVWECERPRRKERRRGKSDLIDAALAARRLLAGDGLCRPRGGGRREEPRLLLLERRSAIQARTAAVNQLRSLVVTAPDQLRERLGKLTGERLAREAASSAESTTRRFSSPAGAPRLRMSSSRPWVCASKKRARSSGTVRESRTRARSRSGSR